MGAPEALPIEAWSRTIDLNLVSVARSNLVFLPLLIAQGSGHVVNTSSASGLLAYGFDRLPYVATKHAVVGISEALAPYLARRASASPACAPPASPRTSSSRSPCTARRRGPGCPRHPIVFPDVVGELVADAVAAGTFLVVTAPEIHDTLRARRRSRGLHNR